MAIKPPTCSTFRILGSITVDARKFLQAFNIIMCFHLEVPVNLVSRKNFMRVSLSQVSLFFLVNEVGVFFNFHLSK